MQQDDIKIFQKKKVLIICLLVALVSATLIITLIATNRSDGPRELDPPDDPAVDDTINVVKPQDETEDTTTKPNNSYDTAEPLDMTGINGLGYVSNGDGTCYISGIGTCENTELKIPAYSPSGDKVTKIATSAFINNTQLVSISIPSTVKSIGTGAFRGCAGLVAINVDTENTVYCSAGGVLMSKDKSVLVCVPMNRAGSTYLLYSGTKAIAAYAFEGVINLKSLLYEGTISSFQKIDILMGNGILDQIAITCNYVPLK